MPPRFTILFRDRDGRNRYFIVHAENYQEAETLLYQAMGWEREIISMSVG